MAHLEGVAVGDEPLMIDQLDQQLGGMTTAFTGKTGTIAVQVSNTEAPPVLDQFSPPPPLLDIRFLFGQALDLGEVVAD